MKKPTQHYGMTFRRSMLKNLAMLMGSSYVKQKNTVLIAQGRRQGWTYITKLASSVGRISISLKQT